MKPDFTDNQFLKESIYLVVRIRNYSITFILNIIFQFISKINNKQIKYQNR